MQLLNKNYDFPLKYDKIRHNMKNTYKERKNGRRKTKEKKGNVK